MYVEEKERSVHGPPQWQTPSVERLKQEEVSGR